ncbi:hypothetical protein BKH41_01725 [Helicobacter sp. 12S02232-10]|uniref:glycosyltransferase family 4 protein n=1 Tax=Helicobacter sp. 12S02232-10 TaxID=1476197 RepID=UPI000BA58655|nr:MraY family glycosyltransferase [Helicobacter sp. 12S02232-10]PAF49412.1 hypothetical protein BKH41_01725 [Helicobacter sp. 12S02232-10]
MELSRIIGIIEIGLVAFFISLISSLIVIFLSKKFHIFIDTTNSDKPQRFHDIPTPRAGGIGIFLSFSLVLFHINLSSLYFLSALLITFLSGLMEDFSASLSPKVRLLVQFLGASVAVFGMQAVITDLSPIVTLPYLLGIAFSLFGIIGVCNAINIIDGFNGLAGGICAMAFIVIGIGAFEFNCDFVLFASIIGFCATLGFLSVNFPQGKIFLGDGGAYLLGFVIAILLVILTQENSEISAWFGLSVMIYPVWEVLFSIMRRILNKQSATQPDKKHLHTLIYQKIQNNPLTALVIWLFNLPFMVLALIFINQAWVLIGLSLAFIAIYGIIYFFLNSSLRSSQSF